MPLVSCLEDQMDHEFHQLSQDYRSNSKVTDKPLSVDVYGKSPYDGSHFTLRPHPSPLNTEKQIQAAIFRLSSHVESPPDVRDSSKSSSTNEWRRPSNPSSTLSSCRPSPATTPSWTMSSCTTPRSLQSGRWSGLRRPNPKLAMVRRAHGPYASQLEGPLDSNMQSENESSFQGLKTEDSRIIAGPYGGLRSSPLAQFERHLTSRPLSIRSMPSFAVKACIRLPSWQTEKLYRFPSSVDLQREGLQCKSNPCTAPGSPAGSTQTTPAGSTRTTPADSTRTTPASTPVISAASSEMSTLRSLKDLDQMIVGPDSKISGTFSIDSLRTHVENTQALDLQVPRPQISHPQTIYEQGSLTSVSHAQDPCSPVHHPLASHPNTSETQSHDNGAHNVSDVETGMAAFDRAISKRMARGNFEWHHEGQSYNVPHRSYSIHSESSESEVQKRKTMMRRAKGVLRRLKVKNARRA